MQIQFQIQNRSVKKIYLLAKLDIFQQTQIPSSYGVVMIGSALDWEVTQIPRPPRSKKNK
jgi:hypothetical protein